jgi:trehalose 6-phosphate synthase
MEPEEKQARMHRMRRVVKEQNIYRWAGSLITELCELRLEGADHPQEKFHSSVGAA